MRRLIQIFVALLLVGWMLLSCGTSPSTDATPYYTFTDDTGATVVLPDKPTRVAVLFASYAEIWTLAGGTVAITVGEAVERGYAPADAVLVDAGAGKTIHTEALLAAEPDFVLASADIAAQAETAAWLASLGVPVAQMRVESFTDYLRVLRICTDITGNTAAYETYGTVVQAEIDAVFADLPPEQGETILFLRAGSSERSTKAKRSTDHFACAMLQELGCENIADSAPLLIDGLSMEEILRANPARIFIVTMGDDDAARRHVETMLTASTWQALDAVRAGRVHFLDRTLFHLKPNARWGEAYRILAEIVYENEE